MLQVKQKRVKDAGIYSVVHEMPESITQEELLETINMMNNNPKLDGILVQLPLPKHIDTTTVLEAINPLKMLMVSIHTMLEEWFLIFILSYQQLHLVL